VRHLLRHLDPRFRPPSTGPGSSGTASICPCASPEPGEPDDLEVQESQRIKTCPECNHFLIRYRVGHGLDFSIDRCGACGGLWFDQNEWEILKLRNLHDDVHLIFSAAWQLRAAREEEVQRRRDRLLKQLGAEDFSEVERMHNWLRTHPRRSTILAYLAGR
jgi:Zn-finger nucleic acid-binding protein